MDDVKDYYEANTPTFLRWGRGSRRSGAIHREVWAPGVTTHDDALDFVHTRIIEILSSNQAAWHRVASHRAASTGADRTVDDRSPGSGSHAAPNDDRSDGEHPTPPVYADLGCGVGATVVRVAGATGAVVTGITLSPVQHAAAERRIAADTVSARPGVCSVVLGDFSDPDTLNRACDAAALDGAWMIESFNHARDPRTLLTEIARCMRPGGTLIICDDTPDERLAQPDAHLPRRWRRWRREFLRGWHVHTFLSARAIQATADEVGFELERTEDYSNYIAVDRPRDLLVRLVSGPAALFDLHAGAWDNIRGGNALQQLGKRRLIRYQLLVFRRR